MKILGIPILTILLMASLAIAKDGKAQELLNRRLSIQVLNKEIDKTLLAIEKKSNIKFTYLPGIFPAETKVSLKLKDETLEKVLEELLTPYHIEYHINGEFIILKKTATGTKSNSQARAMEQKQKPQDITVTGTVSDEKGEGLPGVSIILKGTQRGTLTDINGAYSFNIPDLEGVLIFSYVGFIQKEVPLLHQTRLDVTLETDNKTLEEVVVVGYGTQKKSDLTGSVASVGEKQLTAYPAQDAVQAMQGRAPGVQIQAVNGEPGAGYKIRVRGATSINASSDPLFVVDGIVGGVMPPPEDIASIEILKDASATAIYGSRGANGVVMVTSRSGVLGQPKINFVSSYSIQKEVGRQSVLGARDYAEYINESRGTLYYDPNDLSNETDWQDLIFRRGAILNNQLSVSGGTDKVKYYVSGALYNQKGIIQTSDYNRISLNSKIDIAATKRLNLNFSTFLRREKQDGVYTQNSNGANTAGVIASAQRFEPNRGILDENGVYTTSNVGTAPYENPRAVIDGRDIENITENVQSNLQLKYNLLDGLYFNSTLGFSFINSRNGQYDNRLSADGIASNGAGRLTTVRRSNLLNENYFNYNKTLNKIHTLSLVAGYSYQKFDYETFSATNKGFITDAFGFWNLDAGSNWQPASSNTTTSEIVSYYSRLNYNFSDRYIFTATGRYDGASQFSEGNKWSFFPSGAFAWNLGKEAFFPQNKIITAVKIRTSYGLTGNQAIGPYQSFSRISPVLFSSGSTVLNAVRPTAIANKDLTWETTAQFNIGTDIDILDSRINLSADYYIKKTSDLLFTVPITSFSGYTSRTENFGDIENKGVEFAINTRNLVGQFRWTTNFNVTVNRNKVLSLPGGLDREFGGAPGVLRPGNTSILREGSPVGSFFGFIYDGVYQEGDSFIPGAGFEQVAGGEKFRDLDGDGVLTLNDRTIIGNPNPDYLLGLSNDLSYKGFDLNIFFQSSIGGDLFNFTAMELGQLNGITNASTDALNRWTPTNTDTDIPKATTDRTNHSSTRFIENGSYVRLKNIALSYNFPKSILSRVHLSNARIYISGQNVLTFTKYSGVDPEVAYKGSGNVNLGGDYDSYPNVKSYTLGLNITF
ncbi:TonB-dependent receptor [Dyadobacter jejuensis]|nr:TonB-dependent receptor [Dyadobacter jejuensis]